jgi:hypothetical protein
VAVAGARVWEGLWDEQMCCWTSLSHQQTVYCRSPLLHLVGQASGGWPVAAVDMLHRLSAPHRLSSVHSTKGKARVKHKRTHTHTDAGAHVTISCALKHDT